MKWEIPRKTAEVADVMPRKYRSGVFFDCTICGQLLRDCQEHNAPEPRSCPICKGDLKLVGVGANEFVGNASWLRCVACARIFIRRRGDTIETKPRAGFDEYA